MRSYNIIFAFVLLILQLEPSYVGQNLHHDKNNYKVWANSLISDFKYSSSENVDSAKYYKKKFFDIFPYSFKDFVHLYGYYEDNDTSYESLLYGYAKQHIELIGSLDDIIKENDYLTKFVSLAIDGYWQADGVNYFQDLLHSKFNKNITLSIQILRKHPIYAQKGFWHFFFDGPHLPDFKNEIIRKLKSIDIGTYNIASDEIRHLKNEWGY